MSSKNKIGTVSKDVYNKNCELSDHHLERIAKCIEILIDPLKALARELGYNLVVHGSLRRDIDLVAIPWVKAAVSPRQLADAIQLKTQELVGLAIMKDLDGCANPEFFLSGCPGLKPHGRLGWCFHLGGGPYIDLSIVPPEIADTNP